LKEEGLGALTEELVWEEALDLSQERICKQWTTALPSTQSSRHRV